MKFISTVIVFDKGEVSESAGWKAAYDAYKTAILQMVNPPNAADFRIKPIRNWTNKKTGKRESSRNGVGPIKKQFLDRMKNLGWKWEAPLSLEDHIQSINLKEAFLNYPEYTKLAEPLNTSFGNLDFWLTSGDKRVAIEWETGNISSSHRSVNKLCLAILAGTIDIAVVVVPSGKLAGHVTDRIGNLHELMPYFAFWRHATDKVKSGLLVISEVEHDELDDSLQYLGVINAGRGKKSQKAAKRRRK